MVKLSIIIPVYNSECYIEECLSSIIKSKEKEIEIIIVDDGSTDMSREIVSTFKTKDKRIKYFYQTNHGVSVARNLGISVSQGKYIMFVDSDDILDNNCIENFLNNITNSDFLMGGYCTLKNNYMENTYLNYNYFNNIKIFCEDIKKWIDTPYLLSPWCKIFKSDIIKKYNIQFKNEVSYAEDAIFVFEYLQHVSYVKSIAKICYYHRLSNNSLGSGFKEEMFDFDVLATNEIEKLLMKYNVNNVLEIINNRYISTSVIYIKKIINSDMNIFNKFSKIELIKNKYNLIERYRSINNKSLSAKLIYIVFRISFFYPILFLFKKREFGNNV